MANKRQMMRRIREILRLKLDCGLSNRDTARSAGSSPASVSDMLKRAREAGLTTWADVDALHLEYLDAHPDGLQYTAFCDEYRRWLRRRKLSMRQVHRAGEKMFVDYSGAKAEVVDRHTGEIRDAEIFVAALGASSYSYAEATWTQTLPDWTMSHVRAGEFFGGVAEVWVPDQLRSAVLRTHAYDPEINLLLGVDSASAGGHASVTRRVLG